MKYTSIILGLGLCIMLNSSANAAGPGGTHCTAAQMHANPAACQNAQQRIDNGTSHGTSNNSSGTSGSTGTTAGTGNSATAISNQAYDASGIYGHLAPVKGGINAAPPQPGLLPSYFDAGAGCTWSNGTPASCNRGGYSDGVNDRYFPFVPNDGKNHQVGFTQGKCIAPLVPVVVGSVVATQFISSQCYIKDFHVNLWLSEASDHYDVMANSNVHTQQGCDDRSLRVDFTVWCQPAFNNVPDRSGNYRSTHATM